MWSTNKNRLEKSPCCVRHKNLCAAFAATGPGGRGQSATVCLTTNMHPTLTLILSTLHILFTVTGIAGVWPPLAVASTLAPLRVAATAIAACRGGAAAPAASPVPSFVFASAALLAAASARVFLLVVAVVVVVVASEDLVSHFSGPILAALASTATGLPPALPSVLVLFFPLVLIFVSPLRLTAGVFCLAATALFVIITWKTKEKSL